MVILIPLIRRMSTRRRLLTGVVCLLIGAAAVLAAGAAAIPGLVSAAVGVVFILSGLTGRPRPRLPRTSSRAFKGREFGAAQSPR